jgi:hypothetical protein
MIQDGRRVFVSHCSVDREAANQLAEALDRQGVATWIAPRDVAPGRDYSEQLDEAIRDAGAVVVLASAAYGDSIAARGEASQAASLGKAVYPVRVDGEGSPPDFQGAAFWTDAFGANADRNVVRLAEELRATGAGAPPASPSPEPQAVVTPPPAPAGEAAVAPPAAAAPVAAPPTAAAPVASAEPGPPPTGQSRGRKLLFVGLGVAMIIVGLVRMSDGLHRIMGSGGSRPSSSASTAFPTATAPGAAAAPASGAAEAPPQSPGPLPAWAQGFAGDWSDDNCRTALRLSADGTFTARQAGGGASSGYGYWTMASQGAGGDYILSLAGSGGRFQTYRITNVGPSSFTMTATSGGRSSLATRC